MRGSKEDCNEKANERAEGFELLTASSGETATSSKRALHLSVVEKSQAEHECSVAGGNSGYGRKNAEQGPVLWDGEDEVDAGARLQISSQSRRGSMG